MSMRAIRRLTVLAAVAALTVPLGLASAGATDSKSAPATTRTAAADPFPGVYISPWGDAQIELSPELLDWMRTEGITLEAISPFVMDADGRGFSMPIGSTAGDGLDSRGRIFYPGGLNFRHAASNKTITLKPTYIRVMPTPGYSAGVAVNGVPLADEVMIADTTPAEALLGARPSPTGFRLEKVPFRITAEASKLFAEVTGRPGPRVGSLLGTLTPNFDYIPGQRPSPIGFPSF
ncbi:MULTISPECIES: hypothetical protein [Streptomyces]|uniref:hypothetical protein n=1 Tax=Streptomyces TaxID=1883 RepID=UPI0021A2B4F4|nr:MULTISPECIES: hypothetical protein [Streptomyces]MCT2542003.1 hypothetical protein [Streptomyces atratus]MCX4847034.1 hypothetical protein [Streptomyces sp. NBC_00893]